MVRFKNLTCLSLIALLLLSVDAYSNGKEDPISYYFGYYLENEIDSSTISILKKEGFEILETDSVDKVLYVKTSKCSSTPSEIEGKIKKVVYLGSNQKESPKENNSSSSNQEFDFLNVFFFTL